MIDHPPTTAIATARLRLTPLAVDDASAMVEVLADPTLYTFTGGEPPTQEQLERQYGFQVVGPDRDEHWHNWIVRDADNTAMGYVQATVIGTSADVAWVVGTAWQGRGFASEAAAGMCEWLRTQGISRIEAYIHPDHDASAGVARSLGLYATDEIDEDGEVIWRSPV